MSKFTVDKGYVNLDEAEFYLDGERLTEERAEHIGLEECGKIFGRPHIDPERRPSVQIGFRVSQDTSARLKAVAAERGMRQTDVLREALDRYLAAS